ncbi:FtsX-like permease family protein [Mucilaginibacter sp. L3T2-6]|uniref:ABC transporter permease n=1 Tax=Mucilaginibacter sp. L3T2-6 TaxID=3062491 RepID=UPI002674D80F|nr:FtsX-like permease family protein [Mucilaginibacter sp. L3T2-6]MDO3643747.1 FtsX-like permease family protein [Mucilaginibacter sp. L3T2-6]MDV6216198.1 FtsX-like permease family protein [Mucilaginibacter sp. L3T2-6]
MWLIKLSWKNIWRNRSRSMITIAAIFFAVILSVLASSLQEGVFDNLVKNVVSFYTGYVQVHQKGYWDEQVLDNSFPATASLQHQIIRNKNVSALTPRLESFALASSGDITKGALVVGIDPDRENDITSIRQKIVDGRYLVDTDRMVLIAQGFAGKLKLKVNDTVVLIGQGYHGAMAAGKYPVKGIIKFGSPELNDRTLFMPISAAADLYGAGGMATSYVLSLHDLTRLQGTASAISSSLGPGYEVMTWEEIMPEVMQHIRTDTNSMKYIQGILYLLICFGIFGTLLMVMVERKYEMGMLLAIGMKKRRLAGLLMLESMFTVCTGCILGIVVSIPLVYYLHKFPLRMGGETAKAYEKFGFEAVFPTSANPSNFITQGLIVLAVGLVLSLYPIYKIIRLDPVTAMKR